MTKSKKIIFKPKAWRDKNLNYGEKAIVHYLNSSGAYFDLIYSQNNKEEIEEFIVLFENKKHQSLFDKNKYPKQVYDKIEEIKLFLLYDGKYLNCNFKFRIIKNNIEIFYGVNLLDNSFIFYEEIKILAKDLRIKTIPSVWEGNYSNAVDNAFLKNILIQKM